MARLINRDTNGHSTAAARTSVFLRGTARAPIKRRKNLFRGGLGAAPAIHPKTRPLLDLVCNLFSSLILSPPIVRQLQDNPSLLLLTSNMRTIRTRLGVVVLVGAVATVLRNPDVMADAFSLSPPPFSVRRSSVSSYSKRYVSSARNPPSTGSSIPQDDNTDDDMSDEELLRQTPKSQLVDLCEQFGLDTKGTKAALLERLRLFAAEQAERERQRLENRRKRVEEGSDDERERFEIVEGEEIDDDDDDEAVFYYPANVPGEESTAKNDTKSQKKSMKAVETNSQARLTAPPPPPVEPDANGERVVTVYSTTDHNDLTGIAAAQPGQAAVNDPMISGSMSDPMDAPWDVNNPQKKSKQAATTTEVEAAKAQVSELVQTLLAMSGAPGFQQDVDDDLSSLMGGVMRRRQADPYSVPNFVGFDPSTVPTEMLTRASKSLRTGRGAVLAEVLREFELRGVGHDGAAGDDKDRGGGHYRQVSKVRSFLEGYRRAEVRRLARETATMLLDKLVSEGIEGLDMTLATMTRSSDETSDEAGELNDSLLDFLNDSIRQQEKKVEQVVYSVKKVTELENSMSKLAEVEDDAVEKLWLVDTTDEGERVETFNPNDPKNQKVLQDELEREIQQAASSALKKPMAPKSAPEQLLLLLKLLRERIKTEAAFSHDEKSRNLRILAYCLNMESDDSRKELIMREFGSSLDVSAIVSGRKVC